MRLSKLKISSSLTSGKNLKEINLTQKSFGSVVALVGKNGAGKSRVLELVENYFKNMIIENIDENHITKIPPIISQDFLQNLETLKLTVTRYPSNTSQGQNARIQLKNLQTQLLERFRNYGQAFIKVVDNDDLKNIKMSISNDKELTFESILSNSHYDKLIQNPSYIKHTGMQLSENGFLSNEFRAFNSNSTIQYLNKLTNSILTEQVNLYLDQPENLEFINAEIKKNEAYKLFNQFQGYVKKFLGKDFTYKQQRGGNTISSILHFNGKPFNIQHFSPGQKTLFAYAILFFYLDINSKANIKESIIIVDEPEKHLHPEAQIALLDAIREIIKDSGQLWIATHSINILSYLEYDEILMVKDDEIIPPSRTTPGHSFTELMGIDTHINQLSSFINSISDWAYSNFMSQCFKNPDVIFSNDKNDPQFQVFKSFIVSNNSISLLDFGAGKGRMGYTINEDDEIRSKIAYSAFEPDEEHTDILNSIPNVQNVYTRLTGIPDGSYDCVLLCNVLHEINPKSWQESFVQINRVLKDTGYLLIIEDKYLPKGENAHEFGYLILGIDELNVLFDSNKNNFLELKMKDEIYKDRIIFVSLKKEQVVTSAKNIIEAIVTLKKNSLNNIKSLRNGNDVNVGRQYANQTQLYINSELALEDLKKNK